MADSSQQTERQEKVESLVVSSLKPIALQILPQAA